MTDDANLIHSLKSHHPKTWSCFYRSHHLAVWQFIHRRIQCRQTADDITAETFLAALRAIEQFNPQFGSLERWLFGIVRRTLAQHLRKLYRDKKHLTFTHEPINAQAPTTPDPTIKHDVLTILGELPPLESEVLMWMYQDQISVRQIANRLNRSEKAVENLLYRARKRFKSLYPATQMQGFNTHARQPQRTIKTPTPR